VADKEKSVGKVKPCVTPRDCLAKRYLTMRCLAGEKRACKKLEKANE